MVGGRTQLLIGVLLLSLVVIGSPFRASAEPVQPPNPRIPEPIVFIHGIDVGLQCFKTASAKCGANGNSTFIDANRAFRSWNAGYQDWPYGQGLPPESQRLVIQPINYYSCDETALSEPGSPAGDPNQLWLPALDTGLYPTNDDFRHERHHAEPAGPRLTSSHGGRRTSSGDCEWTPGEDIFAPGNLHDNDTRIEHIGYHFAWALYEKYWENPNTRTCIKIVAHSMGGIITRYALSQVVRDDPEFPSELCVSTVVDWSSPHQGVDEPRKGFCSTSGVQACQQVTGSSFLNHLKTLPNPQLLCATPPAGSTTCSSWTIMGADGSHSTYSSDAERGGTFSRECDCDAFIDWHSAVGMWADHKIVYEHVPGRQTIEHAGPLGWNSAPSAHQDRTAVVEYCDLGPGSPCDIGGRGDNGNYEDEWRGQYGGWRRVTNGFWPIRWTWHALSLSIAELEYPFPGQGPPLRVGRAIACGSPVVGSPWPVIRGRKTSVPLASWDAWCEISIDVPTDVNKVYIEATGREPFQMAADGNSECQPGSGTRLTCSLVNPTPGPRTIRLSPGSNTFGDTPVSLRYVALAQDDCGLRRDAGDTFDGASDLDEDRRFPIRECAAGLDLDGGDPEDWYRFEAVAGSRTSFQVDGWDAGDSLELCLFAPSNSGSPWACATNSSGSSRSLTRDLPEAGSWRIRVRGAARNYSLSAEFDREVIPTGGGPNGVVIDASRNRAYVLRQSIDIAVVDLASRRVVNSIPLDLPDTPVGIAIDSSRGSLFASGGTTIFHFRLDDLSLVKAVNVGVSLSKMDVDTSDGRVFVAAGNTHPPGSWAGLVYMEPTNHTFGKEPFGIYPYSVAVNSVTHKKYVSDYAAGRVYVVNQSDDMTGSIAIGGAPYDIAVDSENNRVFAPSSVESKLWVIDGNSDQLQRETVLPTGAFGIAVNDYADEIMLVNSNLIETSRDGSVVKSFTPLVGVRGNEIAVNEATGQALVANTGSGNLEIIDADEVSPETELSQQQSLASASPLASHSSAMQFSFSGSDDLTPTASLRFECAIDGGPMTPCSSPVELSGTARGTHAFAVRAIDLIGNGDPTPAIHEWVDEGTAPGSAVDAQSAPAILNLTGLGGEKLTGTAQAAAGLSEVQVTYSAGVPDVEGFWTIAALTCTDEARKSCSWSSAVPFLPGLYEVTVQASDMDGVPEPYGATKAAVLVI